MTGVFTLTGGFSLTGGLMFTGRIRSPEFNCLKSMKSLKILFVWKDP